MNRRRFLKMLGLTPVAIAVAPLATAEALAGPQPYGLYYSAADAGIISRSDAFAMWNLEWPVSEVLFDERTMARLTAEVSI